MKEFLLILLIIFQRNGCLAMEGTSQFEKSNYNNDLNIAYNSRQG